MRLHLIGLLLLALASESTAQSRKPATVSEIVTYTGEDRQQMLYAGAKSEGAVTWYTSLAGDSYKAIARGFASLCQREGPMRMSAL